jgi:hypothetical protein
MHQGTSPNHNSPQLLTRLLEAFVRWLIALSKRTPYFDIYNFNGDGSIYMGRDWLMPRWMLAPDPDVAGALKPKPWVPVSIRLHHIVRPDLDRHKHDHPWTFISIVARGGYIEERPTSEVPAWVGDDEDSCYVERGPGSIALRRYWHRHRIVHVKPGTLTIFICFRKRQSWGFYTREGKVHWRAYESVHNSAPIT